MTESKIKPHIVVSTDMALGDDYAAVMAICAYAAINKNPLSFIGTFGDRSASEAARNLALVAPRLWKQLGASEETLPGIYKGADGPIGSNVTFTIPKNGIERIIHGDFPKMPDDKPTKIESSKELVKTLIESNIPVALLSIGAPTEAANLTKKLGSLIHYSVAMLGTMGIQGNVGVGTSAEANASRDPKANKKLLEMSVKNKAPFTLVPLECTERKDLLFNKKMIKELEKILGKNSFAYQQLMTIVGPGSFYGDFYRRSTRDKHTYPYTQNIPYGGVVLHDLTAAMVLIDLIKKNDMPLFEYAKQIRVGVDIIGGISANREYMKHFLIDIAGKPTKYYWSEVFELFKKYK